MGKNTIIGFVVIKHENNNTNGYNTLEFIDNCKLLKYFIKDFYLHSDEFLTIKEVKTTEESLILFKELLYDSYQLDMLINKSFIRDTDKIKDNIKYLTDLTKFGDIVENHIYDVLGSVNVSKLRNAICEYIEENGYEEVVYNHNLRDILEIEQIYLYKL